MDFHLPEIGEGVYEAELVAWLVRPGDAVKRGQNLMEVLTDKATMELPSPFAGTIAALLVKPGQKVKVGSAVLAYEPAGQATPTPEQRPEAEPAAPTNGAVRVATPAVAATVKAAPSVRLMARQLGVDLTAVRGSGPAGRVLVADLTNHVAVAPPPPGPKPRPEPSFDYGRPGSRLPLVGLRRKVAERMVQSKTTIPHYSYIDECDVTDLVRLRDSLKEPFAQAGVKLTYLAFVVKAVVRALKEIPIVNASLDVPANEIVLHDRYDIGVAVAAPAGLIVPVVRDADKKDLTTIARDIERLGSDARAGRPKLDDLRGSTFTVTSVGNIGGLISTPVINPPEVGILGIGKVVKRPVFDDRGQIRPADVVYLSFSFDHRVLDGAVGAAFGNAVLRHLRAPATLLLPETLA